MQVNPPEIQNAEANYEAALARSKQADIELEAKRDMSREAQRRATAAQQRLTAERAALRAAQHALTAALAEGKPVKDLQQEVSGLQANISSLEVLLTEANNEAVERDKDLYKASAPIASAEQAVRETRFMLLTAQLAKAIVPVIPIARELDRLSHGLGIGLSESGYCFDLSRPKIGRYLVADDGSLSFYLS
jgi:chromosome segregation ATPase